MAVLLNFFLSVGYCYLIGICPKDSDTQQNYMCSSNDEKQTWLTALKKIIRDFQLKEVAERKGTCLDALAILLWLDARHFVLYRDCILTPGRNWRLVVTTCGKCEESRTTEEVTCPLSFLRTSRRTWGG